MKAHVEVLIAGLLIALVPAAAWLGVERSRLNGTLMPISFDPSDMLEIEIGMSVAQVYGVLGEPLYLGSNIDEDGNILVISEEVEDVSLANALRLAEISARKSVSLRISYAKPKVGATGHVRFDVVIVEGHVAKKESGIYID